VARRLPFGVQPGAAARGAWDEDAGQCLAVEPAMLQPGSSRVGVSAGCLGAEGGLPGDCRSTWQTLEDRQNTGWRTGHDPADRRSLPGLLLLHPRARNRPFDPAFDDRRTLDRNSKLTTQNVKDVSRLDKSRYGAPGEGIIGISSK
jgi:hypothetical protein